ncbi:hypothetical protein REPUB_Repub13aG0106600 [Reevesia pubescens]
MEVIALCIPLIASFHIEDMKYSYSLISATIILIAIAQLRFKFSDISFWDILVQVALQIIVVNLRGTELLVCIANVVLLIAVIEYKFKYVQLQPTVAADAMQNVGDARLEKRKGKDTLKAFFCT